MSKQNRNSKTKTIALLGILTGIIILMAFTPVGYLRLAAVSISFLMIPVAIGSIAKALGTVFGITSFVQCFGMDVFGTYLASKNVFFTFIMCVVCRALAGLCAGFIFKLITRLTKNVFVRSSITGLSAALFNTIFFVTALILFFGKSTVGEATGLNPELSFFALFGAIVGVNAVLEAIASFIVTGAVGTALFKAKLIED